ncbi:MAG: FAD:protein FMN transferase [Burkholderiaceae bacterium]|nr:FAD:protein FMN transferase [Burkholderiaceae bacterium]
MKKIIALSLLLASFNVTANWAIYKVDSFALGTLVNAQFKTSTVEEAQRCYDIANNETRRLENIFSTYIPNSDISQLSSSVNQWVRVNPETAEILELSKKIAKDTQGAFDPTVGALVKLWSVDQSYARVPTEKEIKEALKNVGYEQILIKKNNEGIFARLKKDQVLTLGAIGKGYIADKVIEQLNKNNCFNNLISFGGNVVANGTNLSMKPWTIGLQEPAKERGNFFATVHANNESVVTSGNYEKFFIKNGIKYHHLLDPTTGYPVKATISSVTIINKNSAFADAMCTALFVMGWDKALDYLKAHPEIKAVLVDENLTKIAYTKNLSGILKIANRQYVTKIIQ